LGVVRRTAGAWAGGETAARTAHMRCNGERSMGHPVRRDDLLYEDLPGGFFDRGFRRRIRLQIARYRVE
jgi:hypothetical protein